MIFTIDLPYNSRETVKEMSQEDYVALRAACPFLPEDKDESYWGMHEKMTDMEGIEALFKAGFKEIAIKNFKNCYIPGLQNRSGIKSTESLQSPGVTHVHIPNIGLLAMNQVKVLNDACTDGLQEELDNGWRIIAVCPPNATRRPDYILGKNTGD